ncbi:abortive phage resistance protein [Desulfobacter hydrogenophilus]|uniref:Abortive phage resistance protein n=1 Tax=Desulfobacter hydrogenophilus TaxID=2291 RepID=A0A328FD88_9BACT|nr:AIPR family protein [Desulfobacter hydrogenophilus]NDY72881.1 AIPR family protein [Desulfobacter hydrogenophilus]QBH11796.1 abortive phage resistance protein [Desulfobacter hydrogenophilus]RAM01025.1 abortive phage resistance protein [Desulfobacter hydrogenophilus]
MNINASIIDQRVTGIVEDHPEWLPEGSDINKKKSAAFVLLCISTCLEMPLEDAAELITEGGNDAGVDGLHVGEVEDGEFLVTIFQGKYKVKDLKGEANFPENGVQKAVDTVQVLFDPYRRVALNKKIAPKIEEIRSLIRDAYIPNVRVILCNNGAQWTEQTGNWINEAKKDYGDKVDFVHFNHDSIVNILQRSKKVDTTLTLNGQAIVEDMNYMRVLVGRVSVQEIHRLFNDHGDKLLERNIRRYLGLHTNRVNTAIHETLCDSQRSDKFYFYNNGITVVCEKFDYNAFQKSDYKVQLKNMQVINGGQTCKTIQETLNGDLPGIVGESAYVMVRIYQLAETHKDFVQDITYATNSQNPVDLRDLRSNDEIQKQLEIGIADLGYTYKRQCEEGGGGSSVITSSIVAESVLAIWRQRPHQAKFRRKEHFGKLYEDIFKDLNAAQALLAVLIFRAVENERKRPTSSTPPDFMPYASHYISMLIGRKLMADMGVSLIEVSHRNFQKIVQKFEHGQAEYHANAVNDVIDALKACYGEREISLQQLSATFRRGDLLETLGSHD